MGTELAENSLHNSCFQALYKMGSLSINILGLLAETDDPHSVQARLKVSRLTFENIIGKFVSMDLIEEGVVTEKGRRILKYYQGLDSEVVTLLHLGKKPKDKESLRIHIRNLRPDVTDGSLKESLSKLIGRKFALGLGEGYVRNTSEFLGTQNAIGTTQPKSEPVADSVEDIYRRLDHPFVTVKSKTLLSLVQDLERLRDAYSFFVRGREEVSVYSPTGKLSDEQQKRAAAVLESGKKVEREINRLKELLTQLDEYDLGKEIKLPLQPQKTQEHVIAIQLHPTDQKIVRAIKEGKRTQGEINRYVGITQGATSLHLQGLKAAGYVQQTRVGRRFVYNLNPAKFPDAKPLDEAELGKYTSVKHPRGHAKISRRRRSEAQPTVDDLKIYNVPQQIVESPGLNGIYREMEDMIKGHWSGLSDGDRMGTRSLLREWSDYTLSVIQQPNAVGLAREHSNNNFFPKYFKLESAKVLI